MEIMDESGFPVGNVVSDVATVEQVKPKGTGRFIHELQKEDVLTERFLEPEEGLRTVELWARSAAFYLMKLAHPELTEKQLGESFQYRLSHLAHYLREDIQARSELGRQRYGEALRAHNGRDALVDAYQELLDAWVYLRQHREEQEVKK